MRVLLTIITATCLAAPAVAGDALVKAAEDAAYGLICRKDSNARPEFRNGFSPSRGVSVGGIAFALVCGEVQPTREESWSRWYGLTRDGENWFVFADGFLPRERQATHYKSVKQYCGSGGSSIGGSVSGNIKRSVSKNGTLTFSNIPK